MKVNLRQYARDKECQIRLPGVCSFDTSTTVLAHLRHIGISGIGLKAHDILGAHACWNCHTYVDTHFDDATMVAFYDGIARTIALVCEKGILKW